MQVQTILFSKRFYTLSKAKSWLSHHGYKTDVDIKPNHFRFRQVDPSDFIQESFRTKTFDKGISIVIGKLI